MSTEWLRPERLADRARMHAALADAQRLAVVEELLLSDRSPSWFARQMGLPTNLVAHHVNTLVAAGLVARSRSEADRRRTYLQLTAAGRAMAEPRPVSAREVVFVCTHNSARSQFAEALWRQSSTVPVQSGGTSPADRVHPTAARVASAHGVDLFAARPKIVPPEALAEALVITVCDNADEQTPVPHLHWSVPDPVAGGRKRAFDDAWNEIAGRIETLVETLEKTQ